MSRYYSILMLAGLSFISTLPAFAQEIVSLDAGSAHIMRPNSPGGVLTPPSTASYGSVVAEFLKSRGLDNSTATSLRESAEWKSTKIDRSHLKMEQEVEGLSVYGTYVKAAFSPQGELVNLIENLARLSPVGVVPSQITPDKALLTALVKLYPGQTFNLAPKGRVDNTTTFSAGSFFYSDPTVTAIAVPMTDNQLRAGYLVETWSNETNQLHHSVVGGDGRILLVESRTNQDSYNVFTNSPAKTVQKIVSGPTVGSNNESPSGWLAGNQTTWNISGNNAHAYLDTDANNAADSGGNTVSDGNFVTSADFGISPSTDSNKAVAVQNLFYLNNIAHDKLYAHGFNEAAGNFQINNFQKGGFGNDPVNAEAQDGSGTDNANFSTPADGTSPRMQMYLWIGAGNTHEVLVESTSYKAMGASFGTKLTTTGINGSLAVASPINACSKVTGVSGKIAIVDRGTCNFTDKVLNAQSAGAIAVIVANNVDTEIFTMGGSNSRVKIGSVMVSQSDGNMLKTLIAKSSTIRLKNPQPLQIDGDLDSDIVYHEYGHGLTWCMIGGMSGPLAGAIGEGASDVNAFTMNLDDRIGEYAYSNTNGIRRYPYAGYPLTYSSVTGAEVHDDGEIYAAAMWKVLQNYIAAGQTVDVFYDDFVDGMNYTPSSPAFEDMRDGMVQAAGTDRECLIWQGFAAQGIGVGADGALILKKGVTTVKIIESFDLPTKCTNP